MCRLYIVQIFVSFALVIACSFGAQEDAEDLPLVHCETTKGPLTIEVHKDWSPLGAERFLELVQDNFFTDIAFFRCVEGFLTQFGISENPEKKHWHNENIPDDPNLHLGIRKNVVSFAGGGANTRSTQLFIAFEDLDFLGKEPWETPFAMVIEGENTLKSLYKGYGDIPPFGRGPDQQKIHNQGNAYIHRNFPKIDFINSCELVYSPKEKFVASEPVQEQQEEESLQEGEETVVVEEVAKEEEQPPPEDQEKLEKEEPIFRLGDKGKVDISGDSFLSRSTNSSGLDEMGLMLKSMVFLSMLIIYLVVYRLLYGGSKSGTLPSFSTGKAQ